MIICGKELSLFIKFINNKRFFITKDKFYFSKLLINYKKYK